MMRTPIHRRSLLAGLGLALPLAAALRPATALADTFLPAGGAAGPSTLVGFIETPRAGERIQSRGPLTVSGWVVDQTAQGWAGVVKVEVYDGRAEAGGVLLGSGPVSVSRPDVAAYFGNPYWANSGFEVDVNADDVDWGIRTLSVYAVTADRGRWALSTSVVKLAQVPGPGDAFPNDPLIRVIDPLPAEVLRTAPRRTYGIAVDRNVLSSDSGVDRVEIYLGPRESGGRRVAVAQLGKRYGEPTLDMNAGRFESAGWDAIWDPRMYGNGEHDLIVYARRSGTEIWGQSRARVTIAL